MKQIRNIKLPNIPSAKGGGGGGDVAASLSAPSFNILQGNSNAELLGDINQNVSRPVRAYVVGNDITTQQSLDRNIVNNAILGGK